MPFSLDLPRQLSIRIPLSSSPPRLQPPSPPVVTPHHPMQPWSESPCSSPVSSLSSPGSSSSGSSVESPNMCSSSCLSPEALSGISSASDGEWNWQAKFYGGREGTEDEEEEDEEGCSTPKSSESRIPETLFCPPAPRKRRAPQGRLHSKRASHVNVLIVPDFDAVFPTLRKPPPRIQRHLV